MTAEVWKSIVKGWCVTAAAAGVGWAVTAGVVPAELSTKTQAAVASVLLGLASAYLAARERLQAEARAQLPPTATWAEIEARMIGIGYGRLLFALKGKSQTELEERVARLEAFAEAIQKTRQAQATGAQ